MAQNARLVQRILTQVVVEGIYEDPTQPRAVQQLPHEAFDA